MILRWIPQYWIDVVGLAVYAMSVPFLLSVMHTAFETWRGSRLKIAFGLFATSACQFVMATYLMLLVATRYQLPLLKTYIVSDMAFWVRPMFLVAAVVTWWALRPNGEM